MSFEISFLQEEAHAYVQERVELPYPGMLGMEEVIARDEQPAVGRGAGALLRTMAAAAGARRAFEVGTNLGYSTLWLLSGMARDGRLDTIEFDEKIAQRATAHFEKAGVADRVRIHRASALDALPALEPPYDVGFLDAAKAEYPQYLDHAQRLLRPGGILLVDNVFWIGRAWDKEQDDADTRGVRELTRRAFADHDMWASAAIAPVEDGMLIAVRR